MADGRNVQKARDGELWIGGLRLSQIASSVEVPKAWTQVRTSVLESDTARTQKVLKEVSFTLSLFHRSETRLKAVLDYWESFDRENLMPVVWGIAGPIAVGQPVGVSCVEPLQGGISGTAEDVLRLNLTATLGAPLVEGILRSSQTRTGQQPMFSSNTSDYATQRINISSGQVNTATVTDSHTQHEKAAIIATTGSIDGEDGERPTLSFNIPTGEDWDTGDLTANDAKSLTIGHTVDGTVVNKTVPQNRPNFYTHETTASVYDAIEDLSWDDGFRINVVSQTNPQGVETSVRFSGSQGGSDKDIIFAASNEIPTGGPFRGSDSGTDGGLTMRIFTATGTGGSTVRTGRGQAIDADGHDLPATAVAILEDGFTQVGVQFAVPARSDSSTWDFTPRYSIAVVADGDYG